MTFQTTIDMYLTDHYLPEWDVRSSHHTLVDADPASTFRAVKEIDLAESTMIRLLFKARGLPGQRLTLRTLERVGFIPLEERPDSEFVLGIVGKFWTPSGDLQRLTPDAFRAFDLPGFAKSTWSFSVVPEGAKTRLYTETRVFCTDDRSRRFFRLYWFVVGPFSGAVRRRALRIAKESAEATNRSTA